MPLGAFAAHVVQGRWFALFAANLFMAMAGGPYIFAIYSNAIKTSLGFDHKTLNTLAFFKNLGASLGVLPGLIHEVAPPWVVLVSGATMNLVGYLMMYLAVSGRTPRPPPSLMCVYIGVAGISQSFYSTGALVTTVNNFPDDRGLVLGLLLGFAGLSGAIITLLHCAFDAANDGAALLRLLAWLPTVILLLFTVSIRIILRSAAGPGRGERKGVLGFLGVSVLVGLYLLVLNVVELKVPGFPRPAYYVTATVLLVILFVLLLAIVVVQEKQAFVQPTAPTSATAAPRDVPETAVTSNSTPTSFFQDVFRPPARGENYTIMQALLSVDMLLLFVATALGIGGMLTAIDNIGQIGQSLGYPQRTISAFVSLVSLSNYAGRVVTGLVSEYVVACYKLPRPLALTVAGVLACVGHLLIALGTPNALYFASLIIGFCLGAHWTVLFAVISEVFGLRHFSTLYNLGTLASPIGSYFLNVLVTGHLYDREAQLQGRPDLTCIGVQCFKVSFVIIAGMTLLGALVSAVLAWRTSAFYRSRFSAAGGVAAVTTETSSGQEAVSSTGATWPSK